MYIKQRLYILLTVLLGTLPFIGQAQNVEDSITVSLITCYPGSDIYELYGHTELRVRTNDSDILYNYGMFDFNSPNFAYRFATGETDYMVKGYDSSYMLYGYETRRIVEQVLNLSSEQAKLVKEKLETNALPENCVYRYNYVYDNCSTRPRDIIESSVDGSLKYSAMPDTLTFRQEMHRYDSNYKWEEFGIDLALGSGLDKTLDYREQMFVPMVLMNAFDGATIMKNGERVPLVKYKRIINPGAEEGDIMPPTPWWQTPLSVALSLLAITILISVYDVKRGKISSWYDSFLYLIAFLAGSLVWFLIFVSTHEATSPNFNGVWLNPFYLLPAILIWVKSCKKLLYYYHFINFAILICSLVSIIWITQCINIAVIPLIIVLAVRSINYLLIYRKK